MNGGIVSPGEAVPAKVTTAFMALSHLQARRAQFYHQMPFDQGERRLSQPDFSDAERMLEKAALQLLERYLRGELDLKVEGPVVAPPKDTSAGGDAMAPVNVRG